MRISDWSSDVCSSDLVEIVDLLRDRHADAGRALEVVEAGAAHGARGAEMHQQRLFARRADAGNLVERAGADRPGALRPVRADREAVDQIGRAPSELQSLMRISYAVFCLKKKKQIH